MSPLFALLCVLFFQTNYGVIVTKVYHESTEAYRWDPENPLLFKVTVDALHCISGKDCVVNCYGYFACHNAVIRGPQNARLTVNCHSDKYQDTDEGFACLNINIYAQNSSELLVNVYNENAELSQATIYAPTHQITPNTYILCGIVDEFNKALNPSSTGSVCGGANVIYSIYGFKAVAWTLSSSNSWSLLQCGTDMSCGSGGIGPNNMICGLSYEYSSCIPLKLTDQMYYNCVFNIPVDPCYYDDTYAPTAKPTQSPTNAPSDEPTVTPSDKPTTPPSEAPTTHSPTRYPSETPLISTEDPTSSPLITTSIPTAEAVTDHPTLSPSDFPSAQPSYAPNEDVITTYDPTLSPNEDVSTTDDPTLSPNDIPTIAPIAVDDTTTETSTTEEEDDDCDLDESLDRSDCNEADDEPTDRCSVLIVSSFDVCYIEPYEQQRDKLWINVKECVCNDIFGGSSYNDDGKQKDCYIKAFQFLSINDVYITYNKTKSDHSACEAQYTLKISVSIYNIDCDYVQDLAQWFGNKGDGLALSLADCNLALSTKRNYLYPAGFGRITNEDAKVKFIDENGDSEEVISGSNSLTIFSTFMYSIALSLFLSMS